MKKKTTMTEADIGVMMSQAKEHLILLEAERGKEGSFPLRVFGDC